MQPKQSITEVCVKELRLVKEALPGVRKELEDRGSAPELSINSLPGFNRKIWGLKKGLTVIGARTSMGKSALVIQMAHDLAKQGIPTLFLSLEMSVENIIERLFCNLGRVDNYDMLTGQMKFNSVYQQKWGVFEEAMDIPLILSCGIGKNFDEVNETIQLLESMPKVIFIDHVQEIRMGRDERQEMNEYIRKFREICIKNNIAGVLCSQVSRQIFDENTGREPTLWNLKGTGGLEEKADTVILLHWQHFYDKSADRNLFKVIIAKQRNGCIGDYALRYEPEFYRFSEIAAEDESGQPNEEDS